MTLPLCSSLSIFASGLGDASIETWARVGLLGVLGFALGFALNRGSICTVIATTELVSEKRPALFIALFEAGVQAFATGLPLIMLRGMSATEQSGVAVARHHRDDAVTD